VRRPCAHGPDAGAACDAPGEHAVGGAEADQRFFEAANVIDWTEATAGRVGEAAQVKDGIADELAGAVIGNVSAAIDFVDGDALTREHFVCREDVAAVGVATKREHGRMFEEEQDVFDAALMT
jgi:hypothetical protein